jgi:single-stranded-DNA-specific exonuclease
LKFRVRQEGALEYGAIGFGMGEQLHLLRGGQDFELAYSLEENHWNGRTEIQLKARAIKPWEGVPASPQNET